MYVPLNVHYKNSRNLHKKGATGVFCCMGGWGIYYFGGHIYDKAKQFF